MTTSQISQIYPWYDRHRNAVHTIARFLNTDEERVAHLLNNRFTTRQLPQAEPEWRNAA